MSKIEDDIEQVVDEFADDLNTPRIESEAERLGIEPSDLFDRIVREARARLLV